MLTDSVKDRIMEMTCGAANRTMSETKGVVQCLDLIIGTLIDSFLDERQMASLIEFIEAGYDTIPEVESGTDIEEIRKGYKQVIDRVKLHSGLRLLRLSP